MAFERPHLGHTTRYQLADYASSRPKLAAFADKDIASDQKPSSLKKLHSCDNPKSNLIISVVEDNPEVLINILSTLDRIFQLEIDPNLADKNVYCVWATNATDHNREFEALRSQVGDSKIDSLAILDGALSAPELKDPDGIPLENEYGHQVYAYLNELRKQGKISKLFAQFQSSSPNWVVDYAYEYEKEESGLKEKIPQELEESFSDFERLHLIPGFDIFHREFCIDNEERFSLLYPERIQEAEADVLLNHMERFFRKKDEETCLFSHYKTLDLLDFKEQLRGVLGSTFSVFNVPDAYREMISEGSYSATILSGNHFNCLKDLKERYRDVVKWFQDNIDSIMNVFGNTRKALVTNKLTGNIDTWMKCLLQVVSTEISK